MVWLILSLLHIFFLAIGFITWLWVGETGTKTKNQKYFHAFEKSCHVRDGRDKEAMFGYPLLAVTAALLA